MTREITVTFTLEGTSPADLNKKEKEMREFLSNSNALKKFLENFNFLKKFL